MKMQRKDQGAQPAPRRRAHVDDTRRAILDAARAAFAEHGYAGTSLDDIVAHARVTKGALYHHFKSKAAVFEALYIEMAESVAGQVNETIAACDGDAWDRILVALNAFFDASAEPSYVRIVLRDAPTVLGAHYGREIDQSIGVGQISQLLEGLREAAMLQDVPLTAAASVLLAAISDVAITMAHAEDPERAREEGSRVVTLLLSGLTTHRGTGPRST